MNEILSFDKLITPTIIQIIFWIGLVFIVIGALGTMFQASFIAGLVGLILGPVFWRVSCEIMIVMFRMNDNLKAIRQQRGA